MTIQEIAKHAAVQMVTGGSACTLAEAREMAATRAMVNGLFPVVYPLLGGRAACFNDPDNLDDRTFAEAQIESALKGEA